MADCLTPAQIEALVSGRLVPTRKARAEAHLAECEKCRGQLDALQNDDQLLGDIKHAYQAVTAVKGARPGTFQPSPPISDAIEGYEILREIHRGGQGVVYKAVQKATKRTVALKVLLQGPYASVRQRYRFEREIDLVASLQHPSIVTLYDSGITKDERHFFAMEYVHGQPLDVYLSDKNLSIADTLRLFQQICAAVNFAHQRGVIHRDLKPGNILIDAEGKPHVLDFGLAKAAGASLTEGVPVTLTGEFMGTLAYASPEQTTGDPNLIDIRTDVYSLGVVLYEMLTSKYPYEVVGQMADVLKNIAEAEPKKPSTIRRQINDEVETIVLKALAKEKERRYQSAEALAVDVEHYLNGEPIDAKRDSGWYILKKALHRYKVPASVMAAFVLLIVGSTVGLSILYREAKSQTNIAQRERQDAREARDEADEARKTEAEQRARAQANLDLAVAATRLIDSVDPNKRKEALANLDEAAKLVEGGLEDDLALQALFRAAIGKKYKDLGHYDEARSHFEWVADTQRRVLGDDDPRTRKMMNDLAMLYLESGSSKKAETLMHDAISSYEPAAEDSHECLTAKYLLGITLAGQEERKEEAEELLTKVYEKRLIELGPDHIDTQLVATALAALSSREGDLLSAESTYRAVYEKYNKLLGPEHSLTLSALNNLAATLAKLDRLDEAGDYFQMITEARTRVLGAPHPHTLLSKSNWADVLLRQGRAKEAEEVASAVLELRRDKLGPEHRKTIGSMDLMARCLQGQNRLDEAEALFKDAIGIARRVLGDRDGRTLLTMAELSYTLGLKHEYTEQVELIRELLELQKEARGDGHPEVIRTMNNLGVALGRLGKFDEAVRLHREAVEKSIAGSLGRKHPETLSFQRNYASVLIKLERYEEAEVQLLEANETAAKMFTPEHAQAIRTARSLVKLYDAWEKPQQADEWRAKLPPRERSAFAILRASELIEQGRHPEAVPLLRQCLEIRLEILPEGHWLIFNTQSVPGEALAGSGKYDEAEPLLLQSLSGLTDHEHEIPEQVHDKRLCEARERIVKLYESWGKPEQAAEWRAESSRIPTVPSESTPP